MTISVYYPCWNELLGVGSGSIKVSVCHGQSVWMLVGVPITSEFPLVLLISVAVCVKIHSAHISQATHENSLSNIKKRSIKKEMVLRPSKLWK